MHSLAYRLTLSALLVCGCGAMAAPLNVGNEPYTAALNGVQSDAGSPPPYAQSFSAPAGSTLDKIVWWGYRGTDNSSGMDPDVFEVLLDAVPQSGTLTIEDDGLLKKYTLDIGDAALSATELSIWNVESDPNSPSFEWFWQGVDGSQYDGVSPFPVAFSLIGTAPDNVPEPNSLALVGLAGLAWVAVRRQRKG